MRKVIDKLSISAFNEVAFILVIILVLSLIESILHKFFALFCIKLQNNITADIRLDISSSIFELETSVIRSHNSGTFIERINQEPNKIFYTFNELRHNIFQLITSISVLFYIFSLSYIIGTILLIMQVIIYILKKARIKKFLSNMKKINSLNDKKTGIINESIKGSYDIKTLGLKNNFKIKIQNERMRSY